MKLFGYHILLLDHSQHEYLAGMVEHDLSTSRNAVRISFLWRLRDKFGPDPDSKESWRE